jgi:hypothetical protein
MVIARFPAEVKAAILRGVKWSVLLALAHYACTWLSLFAWFAVVGHIDAPRTAARDGIALFLSRTHDVLLQPLAHSIRRESNTTAHLTILLNSLLWGIVVGTLLLIGRSRRVRRVVT